VPVSSPGPSGTRTPPHGGDKKIRKTGFGFKGAAKNFGAFFRQANSSVPAAEKVTKVPDSCIFSQPRSIASLRPALYSAGLPRSRKRNGSLICSMWMRPCIGSTALAISRIRRAAFSGSA
jgi:hypothetical protein